jgi:hypothetical protein
MSHYSSSTNYTSNAPYAVYPAETTTRSHRVPRQTMPPTWPDVNQQAWGYHQHSPEYGVINQNAYGGVTAAPGTSTLHQTMPLPPRPNYHALPAHQPWSESAQYVGKSTTTCWFPLTERKTGLWVICLPVPATCIPRNNLLGRWMPTGGIILTLTQHSHLLLEGQHTKPSQLYFKTH